MTEAHRVVHMMCVGDWRGEYEMAGSNMKRREMVDGEEIGCTLLREGVSAEVKGNAMTGDYRRFSYRQFILNQKCQ